jgi:hypothetical protein
VLVSRVAAVRDESGLTLVELLVATAAGVVVMFGISLALIVTLRETSRVTSHVHANQRARLTMTKVIDQLHSACVAPQIAPVQEESTGTLLSFWHQTGAAVAPTPVLSKISLSGTTLSQSDYAAVGGTAPKWIPATTPSSTVQLMTNVSALSASVPIFRYYGYVSGQVSATPFTASPLGTNAAKTVKIAVAFKTAPRTTPIADANAPTEIQNSALLRLTPPSYATSSNNSPCQ